jgi:lipopolysaccharide/colanic/teichoic acid biosynthesis glycosyltransferase
MGIIGPRPEISSITDEYDHEQRQVFKYKPGITGISQISGRQMLTPDERIKMEIKYYKNATFTSDLKIILKTFKVILSNEGNI